MNRNHSRRSEFVCTMCIVIGLVSLGVLTPALASHDVHHEMLAPTRGFDNNGLDDLAVGVPSEDVGADDSAGAVQVLYSTAPDGLSATGDQLWYQDVSGVLDDSEPSDQFGRALAAGDFNGDGRSDLAIGAPFEDVGATNSAGIVSVLYSAGAAGLSSAGDQLWDQNNLSGSIVEADDQLGSALAAGDFNGDHYCDLLIGAPFETWNLVVGAGMVHVLYGSAAGLNNADTAFWHQDMPTVPGAVEGGDWFGFALVTGDFDGDGYADAAIGTPWDDGGAVDSAGSVIVMYGGADGLSATGSTQWHQGLAGVLGAAESSDQFGSALASGDFDGDGFDDLAVGAPTEDVAVLNDNAGAVNVLYGSAAGITDVGDELWRQGSNGVDDTPELNDEFGLALASGDFNADDFDELAIGVPFEDLVADDNPGEGAVQILDGTAGGLAALHTAFWHQTRAIATQNNEANDVFGFALAAGRFNVDPYVDLAVGVPWENIGGSNTDGGSVITIHGSATGLAATSLNQVWYQDIAGVEGGSEDNDRFGYTLAASGPLERYLYMPAVLRES